MKNILLAILLFCIGTSINAQTQYMGAAKSTIITRGNFTTDSCLSVRKNIRINAINLTGSRTDTLISLRQTWNTTANPIALYMDITNTASGSNARLIDFRVNGASRLNYNVSTGTLQIGNSASINAGVLECLTIRGSNLGSLQIAPAFGGRFYSLNNSGITIGANVNADASAVLDVPSTTKGFVGPRMTTAQRTAISNPTPGLEVYDTNFDAKMIFNGTVWTGFRFNGTKFQGFDGTSWIDLN